jgi:hypothetical protein
MSNLTIADKFFPYSFSTEDGKVQQKAVNLELVADVFVSTETVKDIERIHHIRLLLNAPAIKDYDTKVAARHLFNGQIVIQRGKQKIDYTQVEVQRHVLIYLTFEEDIRRFINLVFKDSYLQNLEIISLDEKSSRLKSVEGIEEIEKTETKDEETV